MADNYAFRSFGLSQNYTVGTAITTVSFAVVQQGGTTLTTGAAGNYQPDVLRIENLGAAVPYISLGGASNVTVALGIGIAIGGTKTEYLRVKGTPFAALMSAGTTTLNLTFGEGHS